MSLFLGGILNEIYPFKTSATLNKYNQFYRPIENNYSTHLPPELMSLFLGGIFNIQI